MDTRVAVISIIVENGEMVETLNLILHGYGEYIIGRMGIPYRKGESALSALRWMPRKTPFQLCPVR